MQGLIVGFGYVRFFVSSVAIFPLYFDKWRALAMRVAIVGSSLGIPSFCSLGQLNDTLL